MKEPVQDECGICGEGVSEESGARCPLCRTVICAECARKAEEEGGACPACGMLLRPDMLAPETMS